MSTVDPVVAILRERRHGLGLSQHEVATWAGIHQKTISNAENGINWPGLNTLRLWAGVLGYNVSLTNMHPQAPVANRDLRRAVQDLRVVA
jgi:transcriptional regulator with XRE-family HTH domain